MRRLLAVIAVLVAFVFSLAILQWLDGWIANHWHR